MQRTHVVLALPTIRQALGSLSGVQMTDLFDDHVSSQDAPKKRDWKLVHLVGELNPYGADPSYALYPEPRGASGHRLREFVLGVSTSVYMSDRVFTRRNLCVAHWSRVVARAAAERLVDELIVGDVIVALGRRVTMSFTQQPRPFERLPIISRGATIVSLPHPSGMCREWNDPRAALRARDLLRSVAPSVPWGTV